MPCLLYRIVSWWVCTFRWIYLYCIALYGGKEGQGISLVVCTPRGFCATYSGYELCPLRRGPCFFRLICLLLIQGRAGQDRTLPGTALPIAFEVPTRLMNRRRGTATRVELCEIGRPRGLASENSTATFPPSSMRLLEQSF